MASTTTSTLTASAETSDNTTLLKLSSAEGPVYRHIKNIPLRDARPDEIPIIDLSTISSPSLSSRQSIATQIHQAATHNGFFYVKNHGIASSTIENAYSSALEFFRQSEDIKQKVDATNSKSMNGWKAPKTQRINASESIDVRETFSFRYNPVYDPEVPDEIPENVKNTVTIDDFCWDQTYNLPHFKDHSLDYWRETVKLARTLTRIFALALSLPEEYFDAKIKYPDAGVAINYYPPMPASSEQAGENSIGSHTDFQLFTILWQDNNGGLQVLNRDGEWINAAPIEGTFVVNIGDYLQRITNDRYISTVHRARNLSGKERISMPLFFGFNLDEMCGLLEICVDEEHPARYEAISCRDWVQKRVKAMHTV
ncbi:2og-Fe oxygenase family protein [Mollisia scopiformis]|uniref:2og-Fe oxygenase family protein n=1 Tax=Mollisia scopiformis TaxID=149040 RepID=A0A194XHY1_MOLSC|nr:2og-Fe oxygenase family protein [Mollisia scopiformis]KUJ19734.1 2og-Fe oxygenase family protein [Mollisia scopiformis]